MATTELSTPTLPSAATRERIMEPEIIGLTDRGRVRRRNEDQFMVAKLCRSLEVCQTSAPEATQSPLHQHGWLAMVADGMGGQSAGDLASLVAIDTMRRSAFSALPWPSVGNEEDERTRYHELARGFRRSFAACQARIREASEARRIEGHPGTTLTLAYVVWPDLYMAHAGDSRCYLLRADKLCRLSEDQTLGAEIGIDSTNREAPLNHVLYNAIGGDSQAPDVLLKKERLERGDMLLLCSDGITGHHSDDELRAMLLALQTGQIPSTQACLQQMIDSANERGGRDNLTAVIARF